MDYQREKSAGKINTAQENQVKQFLQDVQRVLRPVAVRNPYAEDIQLPVSVFKPRRTNAHYLVFIEVILSPVSTGAKNRCTYKRGLYRDYS
ncbi:hypothetical protein [Paraflavitalea speifideaquila]|uniref:hypothetical protein n=1 Tax=Paraflavitalea speifideaquila TaxID=3076558 RepID=UPI0028E703C7|nr:hypothetical protein [Paraflavitalea speifideiaquila]